MATVGGAPPGPRYAAALLGGVLILALVLLFVLLYLAIPAPGSLYAMGIVALVLALVSYFLQTLSRDPTVQRSVSWGLAVMGFALLVGTVWLVPDGASLVDQLAVTLVVVVLLALTLVLVFWRLRTVARVEAREEHRAAWDQSQPPSAFDYAAAKTPGSSAVGGPSPPPGPRGP